MRVSQNLGPFLNPNILIQGDSQKNPDAHLEKASADQGHRSQPPVAQPIAPHNPGPQDEFCPRPGEGLKNTEELRVSQLGI